MRRDRPQPQVEVRLARPAAYVGVGREVEDERVPGHLADDPPPVEEIGLHEGKTRVRSVRGEEPPPPKQEVVVGGDLVPAVEQEAAEGAPYETGAPGYEYPRHPPPFLRGRALGRPGRA